MNESIHKFVNRQFGKDSLKYKSLRLKSVVKGYKADTILHRAQKQLLNERVCQTVYMLDCLKSKQCKQGEGLSDKCGSVPGT